MKDIINPSSSIECVQLDNERYYKIANSDEMRPFFMSIVSDSNHWMFISSNGGLTAGRKDSESALFPYYTDDTITESSEITGSKTLLRIQSNNSTNLWEPFSERFNGVYKTTRNLYKNIYGNKIVFEEVNHDLEITFRYQWNSSDAFGFVKKSWLLNESDAAVDVSVIDGIQNIMPYGVSSDLQNNASNLVDAYKRSELEETTGLGIFALSAIIVDKAEPSEALKANVVWSLGLENPIYLLSSLQLKKFRKGLTVTQEVDMKAEKGAYLISTKISLPAKSNKEWMMVANVNQTHSSIASLSDKISNNRDLRELVNTDIQEGTKRLINLNASSDGLQLTADQFKDTRHFSNTLFNIMRGGVFDDNYNIEKWDFKNYLAKANKKVFRTSENILNDLPELFSLSKLKEIGYDSDDKNFRRLCLEYMPLKFSRRHGDPSRPWNKFSINTRNEGDGSKILDYEGNWRDIFQNWEALALSYPEYIESMIHKFLNATTFDGYNPYRVTKSGFDWETIEPDDPWSYIGYWGDHQIIYLLKFLEFIEKYNPGKLESYFNNDLFVYANVPYKIKSYPDLLKNPKDTIDFDLGLDTKINNKRKELGADGALLRDENFFICKVNFIEKILATVLAKVSNFIPEAGIWLNTQRPEWNDANNALVGNGVSVVTLNHLRRFLKFFENVIDESAIENVNISEELLSFYNSVTNTLLTHEGLLKGKISDDDRKTILDGLGMAGSNYRSTIYKQAYSGHKAPIEIKNLKLFLKTTLKYLEHTIDANRREDGLYHAYNLMTVKGKSEISIDYLEEMLEGQVAALSSGYVSSSNCLKLLNALKSSKLFRANQYSYLLYPNKELTGFINKNTVAAYMVERSELLQNLLKEGNSEIIEKDINGKYHFNSNFNNASSLLNALEKLKETHHKSLIEKESVTLLAVFEEVFNHKAFTGRSGTFFGYEGLGSIYWHMVSKLQLAVQECCLKAVEAGESSETIGRLLEHYYEINAGIGVHKSPKLYGAFPTDPYSHTPAGKGAQQPGMTGQVKEDILSRFGYLGVIVQSGQIVFNPCLLRVDEFLKEPKAFDYVNVNQEPETLNLIENSICFTYCQIPIIYHLSEQNNIEVMFKGKKSILMDGLSLSKDLSTMVFNRSGEISSIKVSLLKSICK